jgi:hypothetical protein
MPSHQVEGLVPVMGVQVQVLSPALDETVVKAENNGTLRQVILSAICRSTTSVQATGHSQARGGCLRIYRTHLFTFAKEFSSGAADGLTKDDIVDDDEGYIQKPEW